MNPEGLRTHKSPTVFSPRENPIVHIVCGHVFNSQPNLNLKISFCHFWFFMSKKKKVQSFNRPSNSHQIDFVSCRLRPSGRWLNYKMHTIRTKQRKRQEWPRFFDIFYITLCATGKTKRAHTSLHSLVYCVHMQWKSTPQQELVGCNRSRRSPWFARSAHIIS